MNRKLQNEELGRPSVEEYKSRKKTPVILVLENVRSLHNIGSVFRTADAFGIEAIYLCGYTARPPHREINKTALGATESVSWRYFLTALDAIQHLRTLNYVVASLEQAENTIGLDEYLPEPDRGIAIIMGNEVKGVSQEVVDSSDLCLEIPQSGTKHSLNVSVCSGVVLWDLHLKFKEVGVIANEKP